MTSLRPRRDRFWDYKTKISDDGNRFARTLFDHDTDSLEVNNLAEKAEFLPIVEELAKRLPIGDGLVPSE